MPGRTASPRSSDKLNQPTSFTSASRCAPVLELHAITNLWDSDYVSANVAITVAEGATNSREYWREVTSGHGAQYRKELRSWTGE